MTKHYFIYHIHGHKVGCSKDPRRPIYQAEKLNATWEYLEIIEAGSITPRTAGDIEWDYAEKLGYHYGRHYATCYELSDERKKKISKSLLELFTDPEKRKRKGHPQTEETKNKIAAKNTGQKRTDEQKQRMGEARSKNYTPAWNKGLPKEQQPRYGTTHVVSDQTKEKLREASLRTSKIAQNRPEVKKAQKERITEWWENRRAALLLVLVTMLHTRSGKHLT